MGHLLGSEHYKGQYVDGLRALFIIHNTNETHKKLFDEEYTVILGDWYHNQHDTLDARFLSEGNLGGAEPVPDNALIYFTKDGQYLPPIAGKSLPPISHFSFR